MSIYFLSAFLILSGILHFAKSRFYVRSMPPWIPAHHFCVYFSGIAEIILGIALLLQNTQNWAAWGTMLLLIAVFPANIYMYTSGKFWRIPRVLLLLRLPLQAVLLWWAYLFT